MGVTGGSLWRSHSVAAERHKPPDDGSLARSGVPHYDCATALAGARFPQDFLQPCK